MLTNEDLQAIDRIVGKNLEPITAAIAGLETDVGELKTNLGELKTTLVAVKVKLSLMQGDLHQLVNLRLDDTKRESRLMRIYRSDESAPEE